MLIITTININLVHLHTTIHILQVNVMPTHAFNIDPTFYSLLIQVLFHFCPKVLHQVPTSRAHIYSRNLSLVINDKASPNLPLLYLEASLTFTYPLSLSLSSRKMSLSSVFFSIYFVFLDLAISMCFSHLPPRDREIST